jgi:tetratricopeptide (TPR) repeat protein
MFPMHDRLNQLHRERGELKTQNRQREMLPIQQAIIHETELTGWSYGLVNAWNYLSAIHYQLREYDKAELAARKAMEIYTQEPVQRAETLACYQFMLGKILVGQFRFEEAVTMLDVGIRNYSEFHNPPDEFLKARQNDAELIRVLARDGWQSKFPR